MILLLLALLLVQLVGFVCARLEARRLVHASLARTPEEFETRKAARALAQYR